MPREHRANFINLYIEIGWWGVVCGTAANFLTVYATRLGGNGFQIGILASIVALVNLLLALPASKIVQAHPVHDTTFWFSLIYRLGYFLWIPLPLLFSHQTQIWMLILINLVMAIPWTVQSVSFNALFATVVPPEWRASVSSIRNMSYSAAYMLTVWGAGWLLTHLSFPLNYQVVFGIASAAGMIGCIHIFFIRPRLIPAKAKTAEYATPGTKKTSEAAGISYHKLFSILRSPYGLVLLVLMGINLTQYLPSALFPLFQVNQLHLTDQIIGLGNALFYFTSILASTQVNRLVRRLNQRKISGLGLAMMSLYPLISAAIPSASGFYLASIIGGFGWALVNSTCMNYVLESVPEDEKAAYLSWLTLVTNFSILAGSLAGPVIAGLIGLVNTLILSGILRLVVGYAIFIGIKKPQTRPA